MTAPEGGKCATIVFDKPPAADRKFPCKVCSKVFKRSEHRLRHERAHTQEKPFHCRYCHKRYSRRDLVVRHERTLHSSKYTPKANASRDGERDKSPSKSESNPVEQNDNVPADIEANSTKAGSLTHDGDPDIVASISGCNEPVLQFPPDSNPSAANQHFHVGLKEATALAASNPTTDAYPTSATGHDDTNMYALFGDSANVNTQSGLPPPMQRIDNSHEELSNQPSVDVFPLHDIIFPDLDLFDPFRGLVHGTPDFYGLHDDLGPLGACSPLPQPKEIAPQPTFFHGQVPGPVGDIASSHPQSSMALASLGTTMFPTPLQAQVFPQKTNCVNNCQASFAEQSPASTRSIASSLPEVIKTSQVKRTYFGITPQHRIAIYVDLTSRLSQDDLWGFELPEAQTLEQCLRSYADNFHVHLPIIHLASLNVEETPSPLVLIMCAIGSLYRLERRLAMALYRKATQAFTKSMATWLATNESLMAIDDFTPSLDTTTHQSPLPVWIMQARVLLGVFGTLNGNAGLIKRAFGLLGSQWLDCHLMLSSLSVGQEPSDMTWKDWVQRESSKRIFYGVIILSHMLSTAYGLCPAFSAAQIATLEMPGDQNLWDSSSESQWLLLRRGGPRSTPISLGEAVSKLMYDKTAKETLDDSWKWSPFTTAVALYAVATQIWHISSAKNLGVMPGDNGRHTILSGPGDILETEAALSRCRQLLITSKNASEVPWSDENGPLLFNCMAVLRVAYGRACMLTATMDRFILLRETRGEIIDAVKKYLYVDQPRSQAVSGAVGRSIEGLFVPIQAGLLWTRKTAALTWWVDHALAGWDTALFVTRWVHAIEQAERRRNPVDDLERQTVKEVHRLLREAQIPCAGGDSLAAAVAKFWAQFFTDTWVWGVTPRIGFVLQELAKAYEEEASAFERPKV
ncbi:hypothetical protein EDD36DRAFT_283114 [Exophiala viscosa]|uniref:C2H2-type domain-containing protein n=1 Tax=Exophiala viscosa TaxID=2486360 RepID=A0AAN6DTA9_9EURO|nr:hypothetical protein EDD36DRAFT_283114 [Exophiala viscosa]